MDKQSLLNNLYVAKALYSCYQTNLQTAYNLKNDYKNESNQYQQRLDNESKTQREAILITQDKHVGLLLKIFGFSALAWGILQGIGSCIKSESNPTKSSEVLINNLVFGIVMGILVGGGLIAILIDLIVCKALNAKYKKEYEKNKKIVAAANQKRLVEYRRVSEKKKADLVLLNNRLKRFESQSNSALTAFNKFLSTNFLYKDYQSIIPICQFIKYLESGICSQLEGPFGCYSKYEEELRQNLIINKLDVIYDSLQRIESNQQVMVRTLKSIDANTRSIYSVACDLNDKVGDIAENVKAIKVCEKINAVTGIITAYNTSAILSQMTYYNTHN